MEVQDSGSGSIEPSDQELKISLELGPWSISRRISAEDHSRLVIQCVKDDFGGFCPRIGLEKGLVHSDGRAASSVQKDDGVVILPPPRQEENPTSAAATGGQQQSAARARQQGQRRTGAARQGHRGSQPSRSWADRVTGGSSGTGYVGEADGSSSRQPVTQQQRGQQQARNSAAAARRRAAGADSRRRNLDSRRSSGKGAAGNGAAAESAADSQAVARARQQQQQQQGRQQQQSQESEVPEAAAPEKDAAAAVTKVAAAETGDNQAVARARQRQQQCQQDGQLQQPQAQACETTAAAAEAVTLADLDVPEAAAAAKDASAENAQLRKQNQQLSAKLHEERVRVQAFIDAAAEKAAAAAGRNQGLAAEMKVAAAAAEDARLQREMVAGLQQENIGLAAAEVKLQEELAGLRWRTCVDYVQLVNKMESGIGEIVEDAEKKVHKIYARDELWFQNEIRSEVAARVKLQEELAAERQGWAKLQKKLETEAEDAERKLSDTVAGNERWNQEELKSAAADRKAAAAELVAEKQKAAQLAADAETAAEELAAEGRKSGRLEKQLKKLEKQLAKLKEEKTELKKQVVSDGKIVVSEKIYTRQQAELASYRKKNKISTVREQNAEVLVPFRDDLEKIKEMINSGADGTTDGTADRVEVADAQDGTADGTADESESFEVFSAWLLESSEDEDEKLSRLDGRKKNMSRMQFHNVQVDKSADFIVDLSEN